MPRFSLQPSGLGQHGAVAELRLGLEPKKSCSCPNKCCLKSSVHSDSMCKASLWVLTAMGCDMPCWVSHPAHSSRPMLPQLPGESPDFK